MPLDGVTELWLDTYMSNTATTAHRIAADIAGAMPDDDMIVRLTSDDGLTVSDAGQTWVAWIRDTTLVLWAGNDLDPGMDAVAEVPFTACTHTLHRYVDGAVIRTATWAELAQSLAAAENDGGRGVFDLDGEPVYVA